MKGHDQVVDLLNQVLTAELTAVNQYFIHAKMCQNWGYNVLYERVRAESIDEMKHADMLIERILFLEGVPPELLQEKLDDLAIDRAAFDRDIAQIRRLTPGPVRRTIRRVPGLISGAGRAIDRSGLAPRVRAWITREDPIT